MRPPAIPDLPAALRSLLAQIPRGAITTSGALARALGDVAAARWVGEYLVDHPHNARCACHRVVRSTGDVGLYIADVVEKRARLKQEGRLLSPDRADLNGAMTAADFVCDAPLAPLLAWQDQMGRAVDCRPLAHPPQMFCGLDVAYRRDGTAVGAAVLLEADSLTTVAQETVAIPEAFPYIPGYLSLRELPVLTAAWERVARHAAPVTVCCVDGHGRLHPRRAGVASAFGVTNALPSLGVGKSLLCGRLEPCDDCDLPEARVMHNGEEVGRALASGPGRRPVYVSIGHRLSLDDAVRFTRRMFTTRRLPMATDLADRLTHK